MKKRLLSLMVAAVFGQPASKTIRRGRSHVRDVAFQFRMGAGFPGDVNRTHPASIEPTLIDSADSLPPTAYGQAVLLATANKGVRPYAGGDNATKPYGVTVRPYPTQQSTGGMSSSLGSATPPTSGVIDVLRSGYIMVQIPTTDAAPVKGGAVFVRIAAGTASDPVGGFKSQADAANTVALDTTMCQFNGPADANGNVELMFNI